MYVVTGGDDGEGTTEMYNFDTDTWTFLETAPLHFTYMSYYHGNTLYCPTQKERVMWVYTMGKGWRQFENDNAMSYDLGKFVIF